MGDEIKARRERCEAQIRADFKGRFSDALAQAMARVRAPSPAEYARMLARDHPMIRVTQQDLSAWAAGVIPNWSRMDEMAEAVGVRWQWLLTGEGEQAADRTIPPESPPPVPPAPVTGAPTPAVAPKPRRGKKSA